MHFDPDVIPETSLPSIPLCVVYRPALHTTWRSLTLSHDRSSPVPTAWTAPPPQTPLIIPTFLLYPSQQSSDLISHLCITDPLSLILAPILNPPHPLSVSSSVVYLETAKHRLLKIPKKMTMEEVFVVASQTPGDGVVLKDGCLSLVVLGKGAEEKAWVDKMKSSRDAT